MFQFFDIVFQFKRNKEIVNFSTQKKIVNLRLGQFRNNVTYKWKVFTSKI